MSEARAAGGGARSGAAGGAAAGRARCRPGAPAWRCALAAAAAATLALAGCDGSSAPTDTGAGPASLAVSASVASSGGGPSTSVRDAFLAADTLDLRLVRTQEEDVEVPEEDVVLDRSLAFDASEGSVAVPVRVTLETSPERFFLTLLLRRGPDALFDGRADVTLRAGRSADVEVPLEPVPAAVEASPDSMTFTAIPDTMQAEADVLFATGDTIPPSTLRSPPFWFSTDQSVITVLDDGRVISQGPGRAQARVFADGVGDTVFVDVSGQVQ